MSQIREVKEATNIVEVIGERVDLKLAGSQFRGLCPFHSEKSPSFFVNEQFQRYKCFGCAARGDVFDFLQDYEGMTLHESLEDLAEKAGIKLEKYQSDPREQERKEILSVLELTKTYYHYILTKHKIGKPARDYLKERGVTKESIRLFQIGFAPAGWENLIQYLHKKKQKPLDLLLKAGLVVSNRQQRQYDRFRNRIIFPLRSHRGQVVGFSGRTLEKDAKQAKYINSPETAVYHKSKMLFGYSELLQAIRKKREVIVTEGELDVVSSAQAHVSNVVAIKGSALTQDQARLLSRSVDRIILALDSDSAGITATRRAVEIVRPFGIELRVIELDTKDPDDLARENPKAWREAVKSSLSVYAFFIKVALAKHDTDTPEGRREVITQLAPLIGGIEHSVEKEYYIEQLAQKLNIKQSLVGADIDNFKNRGTQSRFQAKQKKKDEPQKKLTQGQKVEQYLLFLLLKGDKAKLAQRSQDLCKLSLSLPGVLNLLKLLSDTKLSKKNVLNSLPEDMSALAFELSMQEEYLGLLEKIDINKEWDLGFSKLKSLSIKEKITKLSSDLKKIDGKREKTADEVQEEDRLLKKIAKLQRSLSTSKIGH